MSNGVKVLANTILKPNIIDLFLIEEEGERNAITANKQAILQETAQNRRGLEMEDQKGEIEVEVGVEGIEGNRGIEEIEDIGGVIGIEETIEKEVQVEAQVVEVEVLVERDIVDMRDLGEVDMSEDIVLIVVKGREEKEERDQIVETKNIGENILKAAIEKENNQIVNLIAEIEQKNSQSLEKEKENIHLIVESK